MLAHCRRGENQFLLHNELLQTQAVLESPQGKYFELCEASSIRVDQLAYFAVSVFWRSAVWPIIKGHPGPIALGKTYTDHLRRFLLDEEPFPPNVSLHVVLCTPAMAIGGMYSPGGGRTADERFHAYNFLVPGVLFVLAVGQRMPEYMRGMCLVGDARRPLFVVDSVHELVNHNIARVVQNSTPLGSALRHSRST
jgi:hypothetical protein